MQRMPKMDYIRQEGQIRGLSCNAVSSRRLSVETTGLGPKLWSFLKILASGDYRGENGNDLIHLGHLQNTFGHTFDLGKPKLTAGFFQAAERLHDLPDERAVNVVHFGHVKNDSGLLIDRKSVV